MMKEDKKQRCEVTHFQEYPHSDVRFSTDLGRICWDISCEWNFLLYMLKGCLRHPVRKTDNIHIRQ